MTQHAMCFHADEGFVDKASGNYELIRISRDVNGDVEGKYVVVALYADLDRAKENAKLLNIKVGVSEDEAADMRVASIAASKLVRDMDTDVTDDLDEPEPPPEIRIVITDMEGTVIDIVECTKADVRNEMRRNPYGLVSGINTGPFLAES